MLFDLRQTTFLEGSQASILFCFASKRTMLMPANMEHWWDDTGKGNLDFKMKIQPNLKISLVRRSEHSVSVL
jgi:hypothetical protein